MKNNFIMISLTLLFIMPLVSQEQYGRVQVGEEEVKQELDRRIIQGEMQDIEYDDTEKEQLRENIKEGIIMRKLLLSLAEYRKIAVSSDEVDAALAQQRGNYPDEEWAAMLEKLLYTPESFRRTVKEGLLIDRVLKREVLDRISISDGEIQSYYEDHQEEFTTDYGLLPLDEVEDIIAKELTIAKGREETARFMNDLYSRAMFVDGDSTPTQ